MKAKWLGTWAVLLLLCPLGMAAQEKGEKEEAFDAAKLVGQWSYVSGEKSGEKLDKARLGNGKVTITKETITLESDDATYIMKYTLDPGKKPVTISMTMTEGPAQGAIAQGIVRLTGDDLTICYAPTGEAPKAFEAKADSGHHMFVLKRNKPSTATTR